MFPPIHIYLYIYWFVFEKEHFRTKYVVVVRTREVDGLYGSRVYFSSTAAIIYYYYGGGVADDG